MNLLFFDTIILMVAFGFVLRPGWQPLDSFYTSQGYKIKIRPMHCLPKHLYEYFYYVSLGSHPFGPSKSKIDPL